MSAAKVLAEALEVRYGTTETWAAHILEDLRSAGYAVVRVPVVAYKGPNDTDASMLYTAAAKAESARYPVGGSDVGRAVAQVLRDVADQAAERVS